MFLSIYVEKCVLYKNLIYGGFLKIFIYVLFYQNIVVDCKIILFIVGDKYFDKSFIKIRYFRKIDLRVRYWVFFFDNFRRVVDEIYVICELDQSVVECKVRFFVSFYYLFEVNFCYI